LSYPGDHPKKIGYHKKPNLLGNVTKHKATKVTLIIIIIIIIIRMNVIATL